MSATAAKIPVYVEQGAKRSFACAVEWPGWCRSGRDDASALEALFASSPRFARAVGRLGFRAPRDLSALAVVARMRGNATTDFGAPGIMPSADERAMSTADLKRTTAVLRAVWRAFDSAVK